MTDALMLRLLRSGILAAPHPLDPPHPCCWIAGGEDYEPCGLWCGHDGDHTPYTPGAYLPPPLLHPLDILTGWHAPFPCLMCGADAHTVTWDGPFLVARDGEGNAACYWPDSPLTDPDVGDVERAWRFGPCGCEGREVLQRLDAPGE